MAGTIEKRTSDRHNREARIICAYFNGKEYCSAKMLNYCEGGLYLKSVFAFKPGASIYIRIDGPSQRSSDLSFHNGYRTVTLGEVKRCEELSGTGFYKYGIGVRYYQPY